MTLTLWDLLEPVRRRLRPPSRPPHDATKAVAPSPPRPRPPTAPAPRARAKGPASRAGGQAPPARVVKKRPAAAGPSAGSMQARYDDVTRRMLDRYQIRVRKWRTSMSGIAWYVTYRDGHVQRLIEAPRPKGPMSVAVFLHEVGHHAIGFDVYKPRCLEEYHAWRWALEAMAEHNLNITDAVRDRVHRSLHYAVQKAKRRGIKVIPPELTPYLERPPRRKRRG